MIGFGGPHCLDQDICTRNQLEKRITQLALSPDEAST